VLVGVLAGVAVGWGVEVAVGGCGVGVGSLPPPQAEANDAIINITESRINVQIRLRAIKKPSLSLFYRPFRLSRPIAIAGCRAVGPFCQRIQRGDLPRVIMVPYCT
jgi:hypothetical protein